MTNEEFLGIFVTIATVDFYVIKGQRTLQLICRFCEIPMSVGGFLVPKFIKLSLPITIISWSGILYWANSGSAFYAVSALIAFLLFAIMVLMLIILTLPPIRKQGKIV